MRRILPALLLSALVAPVVPAQVAVKAGLSFASTTESEFVPDIDTRTGFVVGISLGIPLGPVVEIRPEALYVQKGGEFSNGDKLEIDELNIPVLLQVNVPASGFSPYLFAGPQAEYELSCTFADVDCVDTNSLRWGFTGGVGVRLGGMFLVEGRYGWTLTEISDDVTSKPRVIKLLAGITFGG